MPPPLILRIITDATNAFKTNDALISSNTKVGQSALLLGADFDKSAAAQVAAGTKAIQVQRAQLASLKEVAAAATVGSDRQIAATVAVEAAQAKLNRSLGITTSATGRFSSSSRTAERDLGKATRGALAGSGVFSGLGRSLAFASGGFLAIASGATLLHDSVTEALTLAATQRQVDAQLKTSGKTWGEYGQRVDAVDLRLSHISGFTNQELLQSFGYLVRVTGNVSTALRLNATAADVARGRHISLSTASIALAKALGGSATALKRLGITIPANVKGMAALNYVSQKFAGQAQAGATEADRFHASLVDTEEIIGTALLPTFDRLTTRLGDWLSRMNESGKLQKDVNQVFSDAGTVFHTLGGFIGFVDKATGSFGNTVKLLIASRLAFAVAGWITSLKSLAVEWGVVGAAATSAGEAQTAAVGASGLAGAAGVSARAAKNLPAVFGEYTGTAEVGAVGAAAVAAQAKVLALRSSLLGLGALGLAPIVIPIALRYESKGGSFLQKNLGQGGAILKDLLLPTSAKDFLGINLFNDIFRYKSAASKLADQIFNAIQDQITKRLHNPDQSSVIPRPFQVPGFQAGRVTQSQPTGPFGTAQPITPFASFQLTMTEQIAQAQAALTKSLADDVKVAKDIIDRIRHLIDIGKLQGASLVQGLEAEAAAQATIQQAADARKAAAQARAAARLAAASTYQIPGYLQLAQAKLEAYGKDTTAILKKIIAAAQKAIDSGGKNWQGEVAAFQVIAAARAQLQQSITFQMPPRLALALARDQALGKDTTKDLLRMKAAILKFIRTHRKNIAAVTDAYNQLASINSQFGQSITNAYGDYRKASTRALTAGLGLTADQRRREEARLSQLGPGGTLPSSGTGAAGYIIDPETGQPVHRSNARRRGRQTGPVYRGGPGGLPQFNPTIDLNVYIDGNQVEATVTKRQQRRRGHNPSQRRGPNAATARA